MTAVLKGFVDVPHGQVHFRYGGRGPVVVMLPDPPRSSVLHIPNIEWLGEHFTVIALDTPGCGDSTPLPQATPEIPDFAAALAATLTALGIERCAVYGLHSGSMIALRFAADHPGRTALAILDGLALPTTSPASAHLAQHLPPMEPAEDGSHLVQQWNRLLDYHRYLPWFERSAATRVARDLPDDLGLHEFATDVLAAGRHGGLACDAATRHVATADIARLASRTVFMCRANDASHDLIDALPQPWPPLCSVERVPPQTAAWRTRLLELLKRAELPRLPWRPPPSRPGTTARPARRAYVDMVHGQVRVRLRGQGGVPLLLLHDVPGASFALEPLAEALAATRLTIVPDVPGLGDSHALPYPSLGSYATALAELLDELACGTVDVFAEGLGACFAIALAAHHPQQVRRLVLDGLPMVRTKERRLYARHYCPLLTPDRHGTHLVKLWQQMRDAEASWPWFDRSADAARRHDPDLDPQRMNANLLAIMKQLPSYGDAPRAALEASVRDILKGVHQPVLLFDAAGDLRYAGTRRSTRYLVDSRTLPRPASVEARARAVRDFLS